MLKAIGFWIENIEDEIQPAPQEFVGVMPQEQRARLASYLARGMTHLSYLGYSWCRFGCRVKPEVMGGRELTDGTWLWPEGLAHYVRHHSVMLPPEFVEHAMTSGTPRLSAKADGDLESDLPGEVSRLPVDQKYWTDWCASQRSPKTLERLRVIQNDGLARAQAESEDKYKAAIAKLVEERGLTDTTCIWKDCPHKALTGGYMCAKHSVNELTVQVSTAPAL